MTTRILFSALLFVLALPAFAQTALAPIAEAVRAQALSLPPQTSIVSLTPADTTHPRQSFTMARTFASDGTFTIEWKSPTAQSFQSFRADGTLASGRITDLTKKATVETKTNPVRSSVETVITMDGKVKSDKTTALKPGIALREELQHLILQAWEYGVRDGLKFQSLSPDGGMVGDFQIVFQPVVDPTSLSNKYQYPAEFKAAIGAKNSYVVADMSLQGIASMFYPFHFYLIYEVTPSGLDWRGYFGEDPKAPIFQYRKESGSGSQAPS